MQAIGGNKHRVVYREYAFKGKTLMSWDILDLTCLRLKVELKAQMVFFICGSLLWPVNRFLFCPLLHYSSVATFLIILHAFML